jgi:bifunctional non-homologous end joining protein LigD
MASRARKTRIPPGAVKRAPPRTLRPVLATLVDAIPGRADDWVFEVKFDGYRLLARIESKGARLITRNGHDWTAKLSHLARSLADMKLKPGWLDGEIVVPGQRGGTSFQVLQNAFESATTREIVYYLFDVPFYDGHDLTRVPLIERRALLESLLADASPPILFSQTFEASPEELLTSACKLGFEGIIGKRKASIYDSRRSPDWIKLKCSQRQEFVIGGWTDPKGSRTGLGSLLLGVHDADGALVYAGKVGTGFDDRSLRELHAKLTSLAASRRPFSGPTPGERQAHWVKPSLVAEVSFSEWTHGGHLRHPVFQGLRSDKPAKAIVREEPEHLLGPDLEEATPGILSRVKISNPDRVIDSSTGATKLDVVRYYASAGTVMMEHLAGRPISLVRYPQGIKRHGFFQKHIERASIEGVRQLDRRLDPAHPPLIEVAEPIGLVSAAQFNVIEFHTWNAVKTHIDKPNRITLDLDPGTGVEWSTLKEVAGLLRAFLTELGLPAFLKTSGGKGLHVVTPIRPQYDWDTVKDLSRAIVEHLARTFPKLVVAKSGARNRIGRIFIDYLRNGFGATTAAAWSVRARPGLGISVPVSWSELSGLKSAAQWTMRNVEDRLKTGNAPWKDYAGSARSISAAMKRLEVSRSREAA